MNQTLKVTRVSSGPFAVNTVVRNRRSRPCVVPHSEYLDSLPSPCPIYSFQINPGLTETFTWLAMQARLWEEYRIVSMIFEWQPAVSANTAVTCHAAVDYDSRDDDPSSIYVMSNFSTYHSWPARLPHRIALDPVLANRAMAYHYVRNGIVTETDIKTYDVGKLCLCIEGDTLAHVGRIQVHYVVEFCSPTIEALIAPETNFSGRHTSTDPFSSHVPWRLADVMERLPPFLGPPLSTTSGGGYHGLQPPEVFCANGTTNCWPVTKDMEGLVSMVLPRDWGVRSDTQPSKWWPALGLKEVGETAHVTHFLDEVPPVYGDFVQNLFEKYNPTYAYRQFDTDDHDSQESLMYRIRAKAGGLLGILSKHGEGNFAWTTIQEVITALYPRLMYWARGSHPMVDMIIVRHDAVQTQLRREKQKEKEMSVKGKEHADDIDTVDTSKSTSKRVEIEGLSTPVGRKR